ncbi:hypothetical protein QR680_010935 [Steinernema hermaphroditum]|uniref:non-specific serine/threonine protein kinase n=1 Tax=Steinernema hermaphroditum TaxID=289476 RepID=A0AA39MCM1_9BILA|nr:hypothetical protein QR680_010935 [Steinernema hermaphroditum]
MSAPRGGRGSSHDFFFGGSTDDGSLSVPPYSPDVPLSATLESASRLTPSRLQLPPSPFFDISSPGTNLSTPGDGNLPPVLLSPVLSRPVRSLSAQSSPFLLRHHNQVSDSEGELCNVWASVTSSGSGLQRKRSSRVSRPSDSSSPLPTPPPYAAASPIGRSTSTSKIGSYHSSGGHLHSGNLTSLRPISPLLTRPYNNSGVMSDSGTKRLYDSFNAHPSTSRIGRMRRRPSTAASGDSSSWLLGANTTSNLVRLRNSSLGRSDPQISASCQSRASALLGVSVSPVSSVVKMRRTTENQRPASRRSLNVSTSPTLAATSPSSLRCRSPVPVVTASAPRPCPQPAKPSGVALRASSKSGSSLAPFHHLDNRRWSLASLPSSSGYGTPGSNSAFSSQYSSQEHLCEMFGDMRLGGRYDSNDSCPSFDDAGIFRPRSRSLHSPMRLNSQTAAEIAARSTIYKERFPKAKSHMEDRLSHFVEDHGVLCGFVSPAMDTSTKADSSPVLRQQKSVDIPSEASTLTAPTVVLRPRSSSGRCREGSPRIMEPSQASNRRSMIESVVDPTMVRLISDGATRFLLHQIVEIAADCLLKSKEDIITCAYFCEMSQRLEDTLAAAQDRTGPESYTYLSKLVKHLLMIVSRPARLLECLEFDPDEFYHLLEEAEGAVREKLGSGNARVPDLPQYIVGKLGLDRDPLMDIPPSDEENDEAEVEKVEPEIPLEGPDLPKIRAPCEEDFDTIRLVSNGAYGAVYLVRHKETKQRFALKKMNKHTLILRNQVDQVYAERDILTFTDNPFVVSFYGSFETKHHLCMLMEYVEGGDCAALLKTCGTLPYDLVRLYMAETVLAIEYLHSYGIVHRDLKPDNLLITAMGHIKLTDFGLSKIGLMSRTTLVSEGCMDVALSACNQQFRDKQLCGTPEYIAPEVILRQGYGNPVDWWALGIILYEFLVGIVPFLGDTPEELFSNIISEEVLYPTDDEALPVEAEHLIRSLMEKNPIERLGTTFGAQELMAHSFFEGLDFNSLLRQKAEFVPNLENEEDTSYFDTRTNRYNHEVDSGDDDVPMFLSFSTASPRHSIVGLDPSMQAHLQELRAQSRQNETLLCKSPSEDHTVSPINSDHDALSDHSGHHPNLRTPTPLRMKPDQLVPSAVLLRRRFSAQRSSNLSTSSSGTAGTPGGTEMGSGTGWIGTSTDSSIDASSFVLAENAGSAAISARRNIPSPMPPTRVPKISSSEEHQSNKELSPVEESTTLSPQNTMPPLVKTQEVVLRGASTLSVSIPPVSTSPSSSSPHQGQHLQYYHTGPPVSPGGSISSASSWDGTGPNPTTSACITNSSESGPLTIGVPQPRKPSLLIKKGPKGYGFTIKSVRVYLGEHSDYYTIEHIVTSVEDNSPAWEAGLRASDLITHVHQQPVSNLNHPQLMHRLLSHGDTINLMVTPLASSSIKEGAARKSIGKMAKRKPKAPARRNHLEKKSRKPSSLLRRLSGKRGGPGDIVPGTSSQKQTFMPRSVSSQDGAILGGSPGSNGPSCSKNGAPSTSGLAVSSLATTSKTASCYLDVDRAGDQLPIIPKQKRLSDVGIIGHRIHLSPGSAQMPPVSPPPPEPSSSRSLRKLSASRLMNRLRKND